MATPHRNDLDPLQNWVVEKFHFTQLLTGTASNQTPLALLALSQSDRLLSDPELLALVAPLDLSQAYLRKHLTAAYRTIEG